MKISAAELCQLLNGSLDGDPEVLVSKPAKIEEAGEGEICFLDSPKYLKYAYTTGASIIVVDERIELENPVKSTIIRVKDARNGFSRILEAYQHSMQNGAANGVDSMAFIHPTAKVSEDVHVAPFCHIAEDAVVEKGAVLLTGTYVGKQAHIGENTQLGPGVSVMHECKIGKRCVIGPGTVVGSEGFGFAPQEDGSFRKVPQTGNVLIEDDVEIGANSCLDRATMGSTIIRKGAKLDNLIQIAHNVEIGENTVIAAQTGISGSTKVGKNCMIGGQVGIVGHIEIADGTRINAQSGVAKTIRKNGIAITGSPAFDYTEAMRAQVVYKQLPDLAARVRQLEAMIKDLEKGE